MNHEELLKVIDEVGYCVENGHTLLKTEITDLIKALRAVVEWHKSDQYGYCIGCDNRCGCYEGDIGQYNTWESCPTIAAIEKALQ